MIISLCFRRLNSIRSSFRDKEKSKNLQTTRFQVNFWRKISNLCIYNSMKYGTIAHFSEVTLRHKWLSLISWEKHMIQDQRYTPFYVDQICHVKRSHRIRNREAMPAISVMQSSVISIRTNTNWNGRHTNFFCFCFISTALRGKIELQFYCNWFLLISQKPQ